MYHVLLDFMAENIVSRDTSEYFNDIHEGKFYNLECSFMHDYESFSEVSSFSYLPYNYRVDTLLFKL